MISIARCSRTRASSIGKMVIFRQSHCSIREVRKAASRAGFYTVCVPERLVVAVSVIRLTTLDGNICSDFVAPRTG